MGLSGAEVLIGALSLLAAWYLGVRSERLSANQYRLSASAFASDWFRDLRSWASEVIDVLSEAAYLAPGKSASTPMPERACVRCRHRISALIDRGRFFIPNYVPDEVGNDKPAAYRGLRHPALDYLVAAEQVLAEAGGLIEQQFGSQRAALVAIKREFVSEIQEILDPRTQNKALARIIKASQGDTQHDRSALDKLISHKPPME